MIVAHRDSASQWAEYKVACSFWGRDVLFTLSEAEVNPPFHRCGLRAVGVCHTPLRVMV